MKILYKRYGSDNIFTATSMYQLIDNAAAWPQTTSDRQMLHMELLLRFVLNLSDEHSPIIAFVLAINSILGLTIIEITDGDRKLFSQ